MVLRPNVTQVLVFGGCDNNGNSVTATYLYDFDADTWTAKASMNIKRCAHAAAMVYMAGERIYTTKYFQNCGET